jgi:prepilin-type N-terminal cleavage/methylation domain-containing protein/prepilin-type processing-associated H-X9-DG protein
MAAPLMKPSPPPSARAATARGFTLLELIVVFAIISILAAVLIPLWMNSQRSARAAECMGNLRQLGAGLSRYLGEHEQTFPALVMARENKQQDVPALDTALRPYVSSEKIFRCPDDAKHLFENTGTSYLWNYKLNGQKLSSLTVSFVRNDTIDQQSRIMVMGDKEGWHPSLKSKLNVLYADGHASQELTFVDEEMPESTEGPKK